MLQLITKNLNKKTHNRMKVNLDERNKAEILMTTNSKKLQYEGHSQFWIFCIYSLTAVVTNILTGHTPNFSSKPILREIPYTLLIHLLVIVI